MSYENQLIREATEGPTWQEVHEDYCLEEAIPEATIPGIEITQQSETRQRRNKWIEEIVIALHTETKQGK